MKTKKSIQLKADALDRMTYLPGNVMQWSGLWEASCNVLREYQAAHYKEGGASDSWIKYLNSMPPEMYLLHLCVESLTEAIYAREQKASVPGNRKGTRRNVAKKQEHEIKLVHGVPFKITKPHQP